MMQQEHFSNQAILTAFIAKAVTSKGSLDEVHTGPLRFTLQEHDTDNACAVESTFENIHYNMRILYSITYTIIHCILYSGAKSNTCTQHDTDNARAVVALNAIRPKLFRACRFGVPCDARKKLHFICTPKSYEAKTCFMLL